MAIPILRVITRLNIGGPARQALLLTKQLAGEFQTTLVAGRTDPSEGELLDEAVPLERLSSLVRPVAPVKDLRALAGLRGLMSRVQPRLIHTHMAKAGSLGRVATIGLRRKPALVHTFHGHVLEGYFSPRVQDVFVRMERALAKRTDVLVAVSGEVRDSLLELGIGAPEQYRVIPLGFDLSRFLEHPEAGTFRRTVGIDVSVPLVAVVGRLVPIKDHATLFRALQKLPDVHLAVVGDGELRHSLEASVRDKGLDERVHFTGWWTDIWEVYADVDLVVLSSRNEGSPVALIEAHASGVPAVATDVGGTRSVVMDGTTGHLVPPSDPSELAQAIDRMLRDPQRARRMGEAGREHVKNRFSQERLVADIRALYMDLVG